jgi:hypothetical protein
MEGSIKQEGRSPSYPGQKARLSPKKPEQKGLAAWL